MSDHKPLLVRLVPLAPSSNSGRLQVCERTWKLPPHDNPRWDQYRHHLSDKLSEWRLQLDWPEDSAAPVSTQQVIDSAAVNLASAVREAADAVFFKPKPSKAASQRFINADIRQVIERRDEALHSIQDSNDVVLYRSLCRKVRSLLRARKRAFRQNQHQKLERLSLGNGKRFWSFFKRLTRTDAVELPDSFLRPDGSLSEGPQDRAEAVRSYFEALGAPAPAPPDSVPPPDLAGPPTVLNLSATERAASINEPLRPGEVHQAISCLKNGSAPGPDGILNELVKRGGLDLEKCLFSLLESA